METSISEPAPGRTHLSLRVEDHCVRWHQIDGKDVGGNRTQVLNKFLPLLLRIISNWDPSGQTEIVPYASFGFTDHTVTSFFQKERNREQGKARQLLGHFPTFRKLFKSTGVDRGEFTRLDFYVTVDGLELRTPEHLDIILRRLARPQQHDFFRAQLSYDVEYLGGSDRSAAQRVLDPRLRPDRYFIYRAKLRMSRESHQETDGTFSIRFLRASNALTSALSFAGGVLYREVFAYHAKDRDWFNEAVSRLDARSIGEFAKICATVDGLAAEIVDVRPHDDFVDVQLQSPAAKDLAHIYDITVESFHPRDHAMLPFVVSEPTAKYSGTFSPSKKLRISQPAYFPFFGQFADERVKISVVDGTLTCESTDNSILQPGEGLTVYWTSPSIDRARLVSVREFVPNTDVNPIYATDKNITKKSLYYSKELFLVRETAEKLRGAQSALEKHNCRLVVWDAYRTRQAQQKIFQWAERQKKLKENLSLYVSHPDLGSVHTRGCAVDVGLADFSGKLLKMPTAFDVFEPAAHRENIRKLSSDSLALKNYLMLDDAMTAAGFVGHEQEWWHYDDIDWELFPLIEADAFYDAIRDEALKEQ